ncbi:MAG: hypothetical protein U1A73_09935 [Pseudomonas sp.]|nr:hypothetical protein [Pseudomonas sp.]
MNRIKNIHLLAACALGLGMAAGAANAQSTDGYHSVQVFPAVAHTPSFTQRFSFHNPDLLNALTITPKYYPSNGTTQAPNHIDCPTFNIPAGKTVTFLTLLQMCPTLATALATGSQFGFLYTSSTSSGPYAGFSRAATPQGNGFTVEAFPASTFTSADSFVNGIRRAAATPSSPTYQTNCFMANLNEVTPAGTATTIHYTLYNSSSAVIGSGDVVLSPGQHVRLSDIFTVGGAPAGDHIDASIRFEELNPNEEPSLMTFCTVQENTTLGADFRIAKQEVGAGGLGYPGDVIGSQDNHVSRETRVAADGVGRPFEIGTGSSANTHVIYFRHPDYVKCELLDTNNARHVDGYGLEMRLLNQDGQALAGGASETGWGDYYLGDKNDRNGGANTRYTIEVESNGLNTGAVRSYKLHCQSGSGHTLGDIIRYKETANRF